MFVEIFNSRAAPCHPGCSRLVLSCHLLVKAKRIPDDSTVIMVTWTVADPAVKTVRLEIQEGGEGEWQPVAGASVLTKSTKEFKVTDLKDDKSYRFRMDMRRTGKQNPVYVWSEVGKSCHFVVGSHIV